MGSVMKKMDNAKLLFKNHITAPHIPRTMVLSKESLQVMLRSAPFVYLKPNDSCQGKGLIRIDLLPQNRYLLRSRDFKTSTIHKDLSSLWAKIQQLQMNRTYVIQKGIHSVTRHGRPFDIRIHLIRIHNVWRVAGIVARVAKKKSIVTNAYSGGKSKRLDVLLRQDLHLSKRTSDLLTKRLIHLSMHATKTISSVYPKWNEFGLDIGIDPHHHLWIYEINIKPGSLVFQNLGQRGYDRLQRMRKRSS